MIGRDRQAARQDVKDPAVPDQEAISSGNDPGGRSPAAWLRVVPPNAALCEPRHIPDMKMPTDQETVTVQLHDNEGAEMTDILNAEVQRRLHEENQAAISLLRDRLDHVIVQNEAQTQALRIIIGSSATDTEALLRFRDEHRRLTAYDRRISDATDTLSAWVIRLFFAGMIAIMVIGLSISGAIDAIRSLFKG